MHHSRRKSGQGEADTSSQRALYGSSRRTTRDGSYRLAKGPLEREREYYEYADDGDGRDTFPQYCMSCEKQFLPTDDSCLYCSEDCREYDENISHRFPARGTASNGYNQAPAARYPAHEPRDIIPRASPSRPPSGYVAGSYSGAGPSYAHHPVTVTHNDAVSALRSLTIRPASPSSVGGSIWPFGGGAARAAGVVAPGYPATYDAAYGRKGYAGQGHYGSSAAERPLPSRRPGGYSRPKSIELVTPVVGR